MQLKIARVREALIYDPATGGFRRRRSIRGISAGANVGHRRQDGRVCIVFDGGRYLRSRLAWFYVHGRWPRNEIDHINGDYNDDRIENLREATRKENMYNTRLRSDNVSGYKGVSWNKKSEKWAAFIHVDGKSKFLGSFVTPDEAHAAYRVAAFAVAGRFARA